MVEMAENAIRPSCYGLLGRGPAGPLRDRRELLMMTWQAWFATWETWPGAIDAPKGIEHLFGVPEGSKIEACLLLVDGRPWYVALSAGSSCGQRRTSRLPWPQARARTL